MNKIKQPLSADGRPLEIERKFLIEYPDISWLKDYPGAETAEITQVYFDTAKERKLRVRSWKTRDGIKYFLTKKKRISGMVHIEEECEITECEFYSLPEKRTGEKRAISKVRYCLPYRGRVVEVDIFPFWKDQAMAEVELGSEDEKVELPEELKVIREVTGEKGYSNYNLAITVNP